MIHTLRCGIIGLIAESIFIPDELSLFADCKIMIIINAGVLCQESAK